ncbi:hypothetical protein NE237_019072 [Protea cynaroides]|uniref:Uncharacterized protein n=1 Tax=Protea cynaroides TaxID=273540 RepID=A0A9Q0KB10_9MAGN|nr:hypothetical protein NE237_019072 [Protea cynaroides]
MARPRALGRSARSFPIVLFPPRGRCTEEVRPGSWRAGLTTPPPLKVISSSKIERMDLTAAAIWFNGTTKKSHAYVTDVSIISDHEDPSRAFGFHSHHHIDDKSPRALP